MGPKSPKNKTQKPKPSKTTLKKKTLVKAPVKFDVLDSEIRKTSKESGDFLKMFLKHKGKTIDALSWEPYATENFNNLKKGSSYEVEGQIEKRRKSLKYDRYSKSDAKFKWIFRSISILSSEKTKTSLDVDDTKTINIITELAHADKNFSDVSLVNVTLENAEIYRYVGCGSCKARGTSRTLCLTCKNRGLPADTKKLFMILRNIHVRDSTGSLKNVVCFDDECKKLLGKSACDFTSDEEAKLLLEKSFYGAMLNLKISSARAKRKRHGQNIFIHDITRISEPVMQRFYTAIYNPEVSERDKFVITDAPSVLFEPGSIMINELPDEIDELNEYNLYSKPSGHVLIINNMNFPNNDRRIGSEKDVDNLENQFKALNFETFKDEDLTVEDFPTRLHQFKRRLVANKVNACVLVVMSHGSLNEIEMSDGKTIDVWRDIISEFSDLNFPEFINRPKIFIFQSCQIFSPPSQNDFLQNASSSYSPILSDIMLCFPAIPGHYGYRDTTKGTFFITVLCDVLKRYAARVDLVEMLNMTQRLMKGNKFVAQSGTVKVEMEQMCYHISLLFKKFRFHISMQTE